MSFHTGPRAIHLVIDSAGFIERAKLDTYGVHCHTTQSVLDEIRDKRTRGFIKALPYTISIDTPAPESITWVHQLAKKTGDYLVLSKTDVEVIALTYELYKDVTGSEPQLKEIKRPTFTDKLFPTQCPPNPDNNNLNRSITIQNDGDFDVKAAFQDLLHNMGSEELLGPVEQDITLEDDTYFVDGEREDDSTQGDESEAPTEKEPEEFVNEDDWITSDNFEAKLKDGLGLGSLRLDEEEDITADEIPSPVQVACLTKDFAMQNVLMHANIPLLALSGKIIKSARTHVLWCGSCYAHTTKQNSYFCKVCGYPNLRRIPVTLHEDGQVEFHFARRFTKNLRGTKFPVSRPKGGKHADDPIYKADQRLPDRRAPKKKNPNVVPMGATNGLLGCDADDLAEDDANADFFVDETVLPSGAEGDIANLMFPSHDVTSRAAVHGLRGDGQIAPTAWECAGMAKASAGSGAVEHGLRPTRHKANRPGRRRIGKKGKLTK